MELILNFIKKHILLFCCLVVVLLSFLTALTGYFVVADREKTHIINSTYYSNFSWIIPMDKYSGLEPSEDGKYIEGSDRFYDNMLLFDMKGRLLEETPIYENRSGGKINWSYPIGENLYSYEVRPEGAAVDLQGAVDENGDVVIQPTFRQLGTFMEGYAIATTEKQEKVVINAKGEIIYNTGLDLDPRQISHVDGSLFLVQKDGIFLKNMKTSEEIDLDRRLTKHLTDIWPAADGGYIAYLYGRRGNTLSDDAYQVFLDEHFQIAGDGQLYWTIDENGEGLRFVERIKDRYIEDATDKPQKSWVTEKGYINEDKEMVLPLDGKILWAMPFSEGKAVVYTSKEEITIIDKNGETLFTAPIALTGEDTISGNALSGVFRDGFAVITAGDGKESVIDDKGRWCMEPFFSYIRPGRNGVFAVGNQTADQWGVLNLKGGSANAE